MLSSPRSVAVDADGNLYIADTLGNQIRLVAGGAATASVTIVPFAAIPAGRTTVFSMGVPTGVGKKTNQGIVLALPDFTNAGAAANRTNYILSTAPNVQGKVKRIAVRRVAYDASTHVVRIFPSARLTAKKTYQLVVRGQPNLTVTLIFNRAGIISETV